MIEALGTIGFAHPWLLATLLLLPLLIWLLRVTPPAPKLLAFPAVRLLLDLQRREESSARTPWWLLALRILAAALVIVGLARPVLNAGQAPGGSGPLLLVVDDGWAAGPDWGARLAAAEAALAEAERAGRPVALLTTAPSARGEAPRLSPVMPAPEMRERVAALRPLPWPPDRAAATEALAPWSASGAAVLWLADGLTHGEADAAFAARLASLGPLTVAVPPAGAQHHVLLAPRSEPARIVARIAATPVPATTTIGVLARTADGRTLARAEATLPPGTTEAEAAIALPPELRNRLAALAIENATSAGAVALLDERWRRRPVGLIAGAAETADQPLLGALYYLDRALAPFTELRRGAVRDLLAREIAVIVLADVDTLTPVEIDALTRWVGEGGVLVRFAGPRLAARPDPLLPVRLRGGDRQLGGALSWQQPARLAPFPQDSPFAGLDVPNDVRVTRQVLAEPALDLVRRTWATLTDGTPLVTGETRGRGAIALFHVTANTEWSNLPLSGLFVAMLQRLVQLSAGVGAATGDAVLAPFETLDGFGRLGAPSAFTTGIAASAIERTVPSPRHPPGFYGPDAARRALNLGATIERLTPLALPEGAAVRPLGVEAAARDLRPWLLGAALALLTLDLLLALWLRGLVRPAPAARAAAVVVGLAFVPAAASAQLDPMQAALETRLAFVVTGIPQVDSVSRAGLVGLTDFVNRRTATNLAEPMGVRPGVDDLSFFPLLYWPVTPDQGALDERGVEALNAFMAEGGIVLFDTRDAGSGQGMAAGAEAALRRVTRGLSIPPLAPVPADHVLTRAFYLLTDFPGRWIGGQVWVQRDQDRANDSVSPVIIGGHDWAAAWAVDETGRNPYAAVPGGARQRLLAYRFGVNLVMYALTGNYKGDQVHVPIILERLGQ
ncbi:DUF4159 domain-containing protein [Elioraea tepidiphila]|uniref:DUF4159 domain-containing protein n=1 Tax=Elioraea tepidiphila TaxID=457934 RepID=UPI002FDA5FFA